MIINQKKKTTPHNNMKKTLTILTLLVSFISFKASAQDDLPQQLKSYLSFQGGISMPGGNFGKSDYYNNSAGYAKNGAVFGFDAAVYIYKNFGIGATFTFQDQGELTTNDATNLSNGYNSSFVKESTTVTAQGRYHSSFLMLGPQYSFVIKKFILDLRASAGIMKSWSTPITDVEFDTSTTDNIEPQQLSSTARAFVYGGSAGLRYSLSDSWDIGFKLNYVNSDGIAIQNSDNPGTTGRLVTKQPITVLQSTLGITLHL
ncbi:outer membrane beta-barrel protein [Mucilaginibacter frigoritolerans]|nr:outer membrane beta-barrel protein [Mucilaginibacter frigoritolerans]